MPFLDIIGGFSSKYVYCCDATFHLCSKVTRRIGPNAQPRNSIRAELAMQSYPPVLCHILVSSQDTNWFEDTVTIYAGAGVFSGIGPLHLNRMRWTS